MPGAGGVYRFDPPPVQHGLFAPIPAQGDPPPPIARSLATLTAILSAWTPGPPQPLIPQLNYEATIAIVYGDQPPPSAQARAIQAGIVAAWQPAPWYPPPTTYEAALLAPAPVVSQPPPSARLPFFAQASQKLSSARR